MDRFSLSKELVHAVWTDGVLKDNEWVKLQQVLTRTHNRSATEDCVRKCLEVLSPSHYFEAPKATIIPAIRRVEKGGADETENYSGIGIVEHLAKLQNPNHTDQHLKDHFQEINTFLRQVTGNSTATLEIPYERDTILVHMDGKTLPLNSLGTGIHEVIILASAATVLQHQVLCIEEPELHLHPLLQKKFVRYLQEHTDNQYFITTHSAHLLDTPDAAIFHIRHQHQQTTVTPAYTDSEKSRICADLGYRASDLLQANCIIWVEGPSDRIYLNHWIHAIASDFIEGLHYSIMFYGGRLLSHLSADDAEVEEFISLRRLNRYCSILIDSDRADRRKRINPTKKRIRIEFDKGPGFAWITKGREIENYVDPQILEEAIKAVYPKAAQLVNTDSYAHSFYYKTARGKLYEKIDKVKVAHKVASFPANLEILDLKENMTKIVQFITNANDFSKT